MFVKRMLALILSGSLLAPAPLGFADQTGPALESASVCSRTGDGAGTTGALVGTAARWF
jgi:hypothetical protein